MLPSFAGIIINHVKLWWCISSFSIVNFCTQMCIIQAAVALAAASVVLENRPSPHLQRKATVLFGEGKRAGVGGKIFQIQLLSERLLDHLWPPVRFFRDPAKSGIIFLAQQGPFVRPNISPKVSGTKHTGTEPYSRLVWGWVFPCIAYTIQLVWGFEYGSHPKGFLPRQFLDQRVGHLQYHLATPFGQPFISMDGNGDFPTIFYTKIWEPSSN